MNYDVVIARYGEIGLKSSKVRARFERKLVKNIKAAIDCEVDRNQGRIYIFPKNYGECLENLNKVFGVVSYSPAVSTYGNYEDIEKTLGEYVDNLVDDGFIG